MQEGDINASNSVLHSKPPQDSLHSFHLSQQLESQYFRPSSSKRWNRFGEIYDKFAPSSL